MPVLPLVLGWLVLAADPSPRVAAGYRPSGTPVDLHDLGRLARLRDPGVLPVRFDDVAARARGEDGETVLAEVAGPGIIRRLWIDPAPSGRATGRLRIELDGRARPALDLPMGELFSGRHPHFPAPLVHEADGSYVCDVPITFRGGCKVVASGTPPRHFQVDLVTLPTADGVTSFTEAPSPADRVALRRASALWTHPADRAEAVSSGADLAQYAVDGDARSTLVYVLPAGPRTIRSVEVEPTPATADAWRSARLRLIWEDDDPADAGVDVPLGLLFGTVRGDAPSQSVLVGHDEPTWSNRFPMPYRRQALLRIDTEARVKGMIRLRTAPAVDPDAGYFRAEARVAHVSPPRADLEWFGDEGRGHLAGTFLVVAAPAGGAPSWGEDEGRFLVDGRPLAGDRSRGGGPTGRRPHGFPLHGTASPASEEGATAESASYCWHLSDPLSFQHSIAARIECPVVIGPAEVRTAAFWYSERPGPARAGR